MIKIYGASDDLIEIEGDIREELTYNENAENNYLAFSDGTVVSIFYDNDGVWRITPTIIGRAKYQKTFEAVSGDDERYSDEVVLEGEDIQWVIHGEEIAISK